MRKHIILAALAAAALFTACTDKFLSVENTGAKPLEEYFNTEEHLQEALIAAYDPLQWADYFSGSYNPYFLMADGMADQLWCGGSDKTDNQHFHLMANYEATPTVELISPLISTLYSGVKRCNDVMYYMDWVPDLPADTAKSLEAQARALRCYYYSVLWKFWGNIPYYEVNLTGDFTGEQFPADEVYEKLVADLEGIIAMNALPMKWGGADLGRVSQAFVYMLYAEVVLYQNDTTRFPKALDYMKEIIGSGQYSLNPDYGNIFKAEGEWCSESIFEIGYKSVGGQRYWSWVNGCGGTIIPRLCSPLNWTGDSVHDSGWGFFVIRQETYDMYDPADARRDATCWYIPEDQRDKYFHRYQDTGIFNEKWIAYTANCDYSSDSDLHFNNNIRVFRYAETLLNAAELVQRGAGSGDGAAWLNEVHGRSLAGQTVSFNLENIKEERRLEFVSEGKRYWDLIRWGDAASTLVPDKYGYRTRTWSENKKYLPFPQGLIDSTKGKKYELKQNDDYLK